MSELSQLQDLLRSLHLSETSHLVSELLREANLFFHLINDLYNHSSIILTSNKGPSEWGELLGDSGITTAILDRIVHRAEVIHLNGDSYRMKHRSSIFEHESVQN